MSAEATVAFFGIRLEIADDDLPGLESRSDARLALARKHGLNWYWGNFAQPHKRYLLFLGDKIGVMGFEGRWEVAVEASVLADRMRETQEKLRKAGFCETASLYLQWQPDA